MGDKITVFSKAKVTVSAPGVFDKFGNQIGPPITGTRDLTLIETWLFRVTKWIRDHQRRLR